MPAAPPVSRDRPAEATSAARLRFSGAPRLSSSMEPARGVQRILRRSLVQRAWDQMVAAEPEQPGERWTPGQPTAGGRPRVGGPATIGWKARLGSTRNAG